MTTEQTHHTSQTKTNPGIGEVTKTIHNHLQPHGKIPPSRIFADNSDQIHLIFPCLTGLGIETRKTKYLTTGNSYFPTTVNSQMWFDSLQQTMKLMIFGNMPFKLLRSPSSTTNRSKHSRLSFNFFYFATGDTQKDSG